MPASRFARSAPLRYSPRVDRSAKGELKVSIWLPRTLWRRAKLRATEEGRPLRLLILDALAGYLNRKEDTKP